MESFLERIAKLPHKKLALLATELYERSRGAGAASEPIAITSMACRFPGDGNTPEQFWSFLERGGDAIELVPEERLAMSRNSVEHIRAQGPIWGGFLREVIGFDPGVFGVSAKEAEVMDPQQRLLLEVCWEALENAGTPIDALDTQTGVFIGVSGIDFALLGLDVEMEPNGYMLTGVAHSVIAGRLSYVFGLNGPSTVMDTACAAAASAIHLACQSLRTHECNQAIAGGINLMLMPEVALMLSEMQVMARDGRCKAFSADADGFVRAEGCGVIVLRRLSDAIARQEPILGVIRGSAWNQDGKSGGLTAPNGVAQEQVIRAALANAQVLPDQISYVEAHGTGTALGDPIELSALGRVFGASSRTQPLIVGSVKTNIGHLEAAAAMPALLKVLLALQHERIPPHLHASTLSPRIDWDKLPIRIPHQSAPWVKGDSPRMAGISAFGISGTNVHMIVSEPPALDEPEPTRHRSRTLLALSAKSRDALVALAGRYADLLAQTPKIDLAGLAAAANQKRAHFAHRLTLIASTSAEAERELRRFSQGDANCQVRVAFVALHRPPRIGMVLGDSVPDAGLLARLREEEPAFRTAYDALSDVAVGNASREFEALRFQIALAELWRTWGIKPSLVVGHGRRGELAAAVVAGSLSPRDAAVWVNASQPTSLAQVAIRPPKIPLLVESIGETVQAGGAMPPGWPPASVGRISGGGEAVRERAQAIVDRLMVPRTDVADAVLDDLASIYLAGTPISWSAFHAGERQEPVLLPNYPFQRTRLWPPEFAVAARIRHAGGAAMADANEGLYRVDWSPTEQQQLSGVESVSNGGRLRTIVLLHRATVPTDDAELALEAMGLRVEKMPIGQGALSPPDLKSLAEGRRDTEWLYLSSHGSAADDPDARFALEDLLVIVQTVLEVGVSAPTLWVATGGAHATSATVRPTEAGLWGLGRVLASEAPNVRASFIDLDARSPDWAGLANLIASGRGDAELALSGGMVLAPRLVPADLGAKPEHPLASAEASYIVTGAFGFIGELTTRWLVKQGAGKLFLVGRNPPKARALEAITDARAAGTEVEVVVADIGTEAGVGTLFASVQADSKPLKGIIHSAGAIDDAAITRQTPASVAHAFGAKAKGAWLLHQQSLHHKLDFFVLYSSAAALIGSPGQSNYAAANCYLDALAHYRRAQGLVALSLNWGLWTETGLAVKREVVQSGASLGAVPITPERGMAVLERAIASNQTQVAVLPLDWVLLRKTLGSRRPPTLLLDLLRAPDDQADTASPGEDLVASYAELFSGTPPTERAALLVEFTRRRVGALLNLDATRPLPDDQPLLDLGLDSLVGLQLKNDLQALTGRTFPATLFFDYPTMSDLAQYFKMLPAEVSSASDARQPRERILV
jgi:acyl transferase domain-containing protein/acyl carrier protein